VEPATGEEAERSDPGERHFVKCVGTITQLTLDWLLDYPHLLPACSGGMART
jgi:hypothetical protein